ncbi:DNA-binding response regulator [Anaerocolumna cellulosilytica]|uniref:Stage 0 sporulation protein A homolog n=1 Tax=Anaerocolumna cellulosilytica TaxID=433286 RepID=A0A6S6R657_9FIRM|nr:response regulator transcription factor [Anaerocolumna cellulosilytica]MBB5195819.1 DNA-binding response OmpR family regulator [Anaerocolumna cellulosilytica]BCJ96829.1 DNA-binding response regulator [Anaerocolumna cellulosilytica]
MSKLLVVDDDLDMLTLVRTALEKDGHQVDTEAAAVNVHPARCRLYDLLLLDVMMPGEDGFSLCSRIRTEVDCPILFLTAKAEDTALVQGFGLGADDYIKKPFSIAELRARVNAHLRREVRQPTRTLSRGGVRFDIQAKVAIVGERTIPFTKSEYAICEHLAMHTGQVFTKEQLYEAIFGYDAAGDSSAVAEHIKNIRAKLKVGDISPIETIWGVGYKWKKNSVL